MLDRAKRTFFYTLTLLLTAAGCNPFAPGIDDEVRPQLEHAFGDRSQLEGFFEYFRNAYELRDSTLYGRIISPDFRFTYLDFKNNSEQQWDRGTEMLSTYNMFRNVQSASLQWNNYIYVDTTSFDTLAIVERAFNLNIIQTDQNIFRGTGSAYFRLTRKASGQPWQIRSWFDKSDF